MTPIRRNNVFPYCGRLIILDKNVKPGADNIFNLKDHPSIDFPMMPKDGIQLDRTANYDVYTGWGIPDGIHQYKGTEPLSITVGFSISIHDENYCANGAYSLLQVAARLHATTLPIGIEEAFRVKVNAADQGQAADEKKTAADPNKKVPEPKPGQNKAGDEQAVVQNAGKPAYASTSTGENAKIFAPVTCRLELLYTLDRGPGIVCTGYVKTVSVKLKGPFLRGPGESFNLPSSGDFSFTFVHRPGHGNDYTENKFPGAIQPHASADIVKNNLYNTRWMTNDIVYQGFLTDT